jgi:monoamine oxidase
VRFTPLLPAEKRTAIDATLVGPVVRVVLRFNRPDGGSWSVGAVRGFNFLHVPGAAFPTYWRSVGPGEPPVVTAWAGGPAAVKLAGRSDEQRLAAALAGLVRGLHTNLRDLVADLGGWKVFDWQSDAFARGAYSYAPAGGLHLPETLAAPVDDVLFFAGEATHPGGHTGTVHGALESAELAVKAIRRAGLGAR